MNTQFGSIENYKKGNICTFDNKLKDYAFSNIYEVCANSDPYEKVVVAKNVEYVIEVLRAEGVSSYFTCKHDEFALIMQSCINIEIYLPKNFNYEKFRSDGTYIISEDNVGKRIGLISASRGHMALLPEKHIYRFSCNQVGVILLQTIYGYHSVERWQDICLK